MVWRESGQRRRGTAAVGDPAAASVGRATPVAAPGRRVREEEAKGVKRKKVRMQGKRKRTMQELKKKG